MERKDGSMKHTPIGLALLALMASLAAGCSGTLEGKKIDYKSAGRAPSLEVPPDLTTVTPDERFAVPDINPSGTATFSAYSRDRSGQVRNAGSAVAPELPNATIERAGSQRWLVVKASPDQVWPVAREFWQENGFLIKIENPEAGIMETDWAENRAKIPQDFIREYLGRVMDALYSTGERDKFRTRIEPGKEPGTTEIYISHRGMIEMLEGGDGGQRTIWQPRPSDPELEAEMLRRLMLRFGVEESRAKSQIATAAQIRARLTKDADGSGRLDLEDPFDRAWRRVGLALDRVGFTVEDRDRTRGVYYVRYVNPELDGATKKDGWFSKLAFWRASEPKKPEQYQIRVADAGERSQVTLLTADGKVDTTENATRILTLLFEQLK